MLVRNTSDLSTELLARCVFMEKSTKICAIIVFFSLSIAAFAQWAERPLTGSPQQTFADRTKLSNLSGMGPQLEVGLVDADKNASQRQAVVDVEVWGVNLVSPNSGHEPRNSEAYLLYRLDNQPVVRTDEKEYTFSNIPPGHHSISVQLAMSNGQPIGNRMVVSVRIPK